MLSVATFDLEDFINELVSNFPNIEEVHIFGSRGYQTNSKRSDIDLLLTPSKSSPIFDKTQLQIFQEGYPPVDLFINREYSAQSVVNNSEILKRTEKSLVEQLDAKCLWQKNNGFCNENSIYLNQDIIKHQEFHASYIPQYDHFETFETIIVSCLQITSTQALYLDEAVKCYTNQCYLGFLSMMGTYYEDLLISFCNAYQNRVSAQHPAHLTHYINNVISPNSRLGAKKRLENLIDFIKSIPNEAQYFRRNGIEAITEFETVFDIIRLYRNDIDHPNGIGYGSRDCDSIIAIFVRYVKDFYDIMATF